MGPAKTPGSVTAPVAKLNVRRPNTAAKVKAIQFGLLSSAAAVKLSVIRERDVLDHSRRVGITQWQELFDPRLGVPNRQHRCATCNGTKRGGCDRPDSCDGHFGHIALPQPIYHPHLIRKCVKVLSSVCLSCGRVLEKKKRKNILNAVFQDGGGGGQGQGPAPAPVSRAGRKRKRGGGRADGPDMVASMVMQSLAHLPVKQEMEEGLRLPHPGPCKQEPIEIDDSTYVPERSGHPTGLPRGTGPPNGGQGVPVLSIDDEPELCKYCGGPDGAGVKLPKIKVKIITKGERNAKVETIRLWVDEKAGVLPKGFWNFVKGHPTNAVDKNRTLLPFEALTILRKISRSDIAKIQMDALVSLPKDFILENIPVSPICNRLAMEDWSSNSKPRVLMRSSRQSIRLEALVRKARQVKPRKPGVREDFGDLQQACEELQLVAARHFRAGKVVEYKMVTGQEIEESGGSLELKWLKANVLAKRSNYSARTVITGDPYMKIEEIGIPIEIARRLTVDERINMMNMQKWQILVDNYMRGDSTDLPGAFCLKKRNGTEVRDLENLRKWSCKGNLRAIDCKLEFGDIITRCLRDGDHVFANRPPSLHKHSLIALTAKIIPLSTFAINPLICPPFDADFDGDAFHVFVPQSLECVAELRELMSVTQQMVCPQGGQSLLGLTQDTLVGGHLLTSGHVFITRVDMQQLSMCCSSRMPVPAIVKVPGQGGSLWTGKQLFSMTLPDGLNFGELCREEQSARGRRIPSKSKTGPEGEVLIRDGEILASQGGAKWLERSPNALVRAICDHAGPKAALDHLNWLQALLHQWFLMRGFSVGLLDFHACEDFRTRMEMLDGVQKSLHIANEASLKLAVKLDRQVQHRLLHPKPQGNSDLLEEHQGSFGLLLGDGTKSERIAALQFSAIERFQGLSPLIDDLIAGYMDPDNSLLAMQKSGSKGSVAKITQQVGCLGLQLFKGDKLLPLRSCKKLSYLETSQGQSNSRIFTETRKDCRPVGYWESRGIIRSSYVDGLNPLEFFLDSTASRLNVMRQGIEEPNQILKGLMLFLRDTHIAYDGTLRSRGGKHVIQFQYGDDMDPHHGTRSAGEPVGVLAATSIAEPAYNVKMQSIHQALALGIAPVQLLKETLLSRWKGKSKLSDRRCILRLPPGFGKERRALNIVKKLQTITVEMITIASAIIFVKLDGKKHVITTDEAGDDDFVAKPFKRLTPWVGHLVLCKKALKERKINLDSLIGRLAKTYSGKAIEGKGIEDNHGICFLHSERCTIAHPHGGGVCIMFFPIIAPESIPSSSFEARSEKMGRILESMMHVILPAILNTTIGGSDALERVRIIWEEGGSASRILHEVVGRPSVRQSRRKDPGELVIEVVVRETKGAVKRGAAWRAVLEACLLVEEAIDWARSGPYSIQETYATHGLAASQHKIVQRLALATENMGKPVREEHLTLVADTMTHCGIVTGLSSAGYRDYCGLLSISTPFSEAAFQHPKKTFIDAAARGAAESIDGVLSSSVWGTRIPLGTGIAFDINLEVPKIMNQKFPLDPLKLLKEAKKSETVRRRSRMKSKGEFRFESVKTATAFNFNAKKSVRETTKDRWTVCEVDDEGRKTRLESMSKSKTTGCKGALENSEEDISDEEVGKVNGKHGLAGIIEVDKDATVLTLKNGFKIRWIDRDQSEVASGEEEIDVQDIGTGIDSSEEVTTEVQSKLGVKSIVPSAQECSRESSPTDSGDVAMRDSGSGAESNQEGIPANTLVVGWSFSGSEPVPVDGKQERRFDECLTPSVVEDDIFREGGAQESVCDTYSEKHPSEISVKVRRAERQTPRDSRQRANLTPGANGFAGETHRHIKEQVSGQRAKLHNILHSRYRVGERVQEDAERMIMEDVLVHHPNSAHKIGCGVDYFKVDHHPKHPESRCFHVVRQDGSCTDFSYHKCLDAKLSKLCRNHYSE